MEPSVQAHDLLDGGGSQLDAIFSKQESLNAEPARVAVLSLQLESGMNAPEADFALRAQRSA